MRKKLLSAIVLASLVSVGYCAEKGLDEPWQSELILPVIAKDRQPAVDGVIEEREWSDAAVVIGAFKDERNLDGNEYAAYIEATEDTLFIGLRTMTEDNAELRAGVKPEAGADQIRAYYDDSIEVWIAPDKDGGSGRSYQILLNSLGARYDVLYDPENATGKKKDESVSLDTRYAGKAEAGCWQAEIAIPLSEVQVAIDKPFGFRLVRTRHNPTKPVDWTPITGGPFTDVKTMGIVRLARIAPVIRQVSLRGKDGGGGDVQFELKNIGATPIDAAVQAYSLAGEGNQEKNVKTQCALAPGETKRIVVDDSKVFGVFKNFIRVTSPDGKDTYFARKFNWPCVRKDPLEQTGRPAAFPLKFAYYPSYDKLRAKIDLRRMAGREKATGVWLKVKDKATGKTLFESGMPALKDSVAEACFDIPRLPQGRYLLEASVEGVSDNVAEREFVRNIYEWEGNTLGVSEEVIPPYTPLVLKDRSVSAVLRTYSLDALGLPEQVISEGKPLLAAPVSLGIVVDGQARKIEVTKPIQFTTVRPNEIRYVSGWKAGPLSGAISGFFDYDGMLKLELAFAMEGGATLDKMDLLIPMAPGMAELMHAVSDRSRYSYIGKTPAGAGTVWKSASLPRNDMPDSDYVVPNLPGTFVPYVWLGNERQGLSWFADNDKDWLFDDSKSTHTVIRDVTATTLKVGSSTRAFLFVERVSRQ
ncbi:MAG: hypothetical protein A3K19_13520 [Lentisphaerae bacterium RIFOXYB12_FULL_65_16]|nr:MAG: hypothetical protein A3K18_29040 [Lentisphaerae bacterium RIFOXYA12_64_32]OGV86311.1 MAG: hypothetical protein A3K19_13520 [Lentisphaerae bacterium RIFOXYB12_FULL_65_16]